MNVPDVAGFVDAQRRLVSGMGSTVTFMLPDTIAYASSVFINPESGKPMDPTASATSVASGAQYPTKVTIIRKPPQTPGVSTSGGDFPAGSIWLRIPAGTYDNAILGSEKVRINDEDFSIKRFYRDGITDVDRLYVECVLVKDALVP